VLLKELEHLAWRLGKHQSAASVRPLGLELGERVGCVQDQLGGAIERAGVALGKRGKSTVVAQLPADVYVRTGDWSQKPARDQRQQSMNWQEWLQRDVQSDVPVIALLPLLPLMLGALCALATGPKTTTADARDWYLNGKLHQ
jgi:hypothetical protein